MASVSVNREAYRNFFAGNAPGTIGAAIRRNAQQVADAARIEAPKDTGALAASIRVKEQSTIFGPPGSFTLTIIAEVPYSAAIHQGTGPAHIPSPNSAYWPPAGPGTSLFVWAGRKGFSPRGVAFAISQQGTKPNQFLKRAFENNWRLGR